MSLLRSIILLFFMSLQACGFSPVHKDYNPYSSGGTDEHLASIKLGEIGEQKSRPEQMLKTNLQKELGLYDNIRNQKYILDLNLARGLSGLGVKKDKEITRYNITYTANFKLKDITSGKIIKKGKSRITGGYDAVESDFGTYTAQKDIEGRIMDEMAKDIKLRLTNFFLKEQHQIKDEDPSS